MGTYDFSVSDVIPASSDAIYDAWLSSDEHSAMTGGLAEIDPQVGGRYSAWDGYIEGETLELEPKRRIVQSWRTSNFTEEHADSQIEVVLERADGGTRVTVNHTTVPDTQRGYQDGGWQKSYFDPMREYFAAR